ncbi:MAG: TetR/AcrR family transcriptional regulator [Symploca sp. SIO2B6]|nr:TetR/AcrR family transcriptional regulator [Symploca sp. SIO2B6]
MSREKTIAKLIGVFRQYGYEGATLSRLSEATGLGRASLYHHFPKGKEEMAEAVLEYINSCFETTILASLRTNDNPSQRLRVMCQNLNKFYSQGQNTCLLNVMSLGQANDLFHAPIQQALKTWIDQLAQVLVEAGIESTIARQRAEDAVIQIQGALVLVRGLDDIAPFKRILANLPENLLEDKIVS